MTGNKRKNTHFLSKPALSKIIEPSQSVNTINKGNRNKNRISIINSYLSFLRLGQGEKANCKKMTNKPTPGKKTKALHNGLNPAFL